jgi:membrane-bound lytic murein transglycosylase MltF
MKRQAGMATENTVVSDNAGDSYYFQAAGPAQHGLFTGLRFVRLLPVFALLLVTVACNRKEAAPAPQATSEPATQPATAPTAEPATAAAAQPAKAAAASLSETNEPEHALVLPLNFSRRTGDLDEMVKQRNIRALVVNSRTGFFYDRGQPHGIFYEALEDFQKFVNQKYKTGNLPIKVTFLPVRPDQVESGLTEGLGDLVATGVIITPEREQRVAFSAPFQTNVKLVVVTGPNFGTLNSLDDLSGKVIYANPLTVAYQKLQQVSDGFTKAGKPPIQVKAADNALRDEDLLEMVNSGLLPATVTTSQRADFWTKVFTNITAHSDIPLATEGQLAWAMRKNNPQFKALVDEFMQSHAAGTSFGNVELQRYLRNTKWVKNSTSAAEMQKFQNNVTFFKKYSDQYNFDYLMIAAQAYQESQLDQSKRNPSGAVGIMQVIPKYAAAAPISVPNVTTAQTNIEAGVKMLNNIADKYFNDGTLDPVNRTLFTFAGYNAGPNRIVRLRKEAKDQGLDPNVWFGNVEVVASRDIGQETVQYVANIYKYYVTYKLTVQQAEARAKAKAATGQ